MWLPVLESRGFVGACFSWVAIRVQCNVAAMHCECNAFLMQPWIALISRAQDSSSMHDETETVQLSIRFEKADIESADRMAKKIGWTKSGIVRIAAELGLKYFRNHEDTLGVIIGTYYDHSGDPPIVHWIDAMTRRLDSIELSIQEQKRDRELIERVRANPSGRRILERLEKKIGSEGASKDAASTSSDQVAR